MKNYTSSVSAETTIGRIETILASYGATHTAKNYENGRVTSLTFSVRGPNDAQIQIRLPVNVEAVFKVLFSEIGRPRRGTEARLKDQALRTAWKLMQDWVEVQLALISMKQADLLQVFLPYVWNGTETFYHRIQMSNFKMLKPPEEK